MDALHILRRSAENNAWSNLRLYRACAKLSAEDFAAKRTSFFPSLPLTLNHILIVDWFYIDALERGGRGQKCFETDMPHPDFASLEKAQRASDERLVAYMRSLPDDGALEVEIEMDRATYVQTDTVANTLMHLFQHQIHHRGQAHAMLAGTPVLPPQLDEFYMQNELHLREAELRDLGLPLV